MKKIGLISILFFILIIFSYFIITNISNNKSSYSKYTINKLKHTYSKNEIDYFVCRKYNNDKNIVNKINMLYKTGYDIETIKKIFKKLSSDEIDYLTKYTYIDNLNSYMNYKIFKVENLDRYINYRNKN